MVESCKDALGFTPTSSNQWDSSWPEFVAEDERVILVDYLENRFGISREVFRDYVWFKRRTTWWMLRRSSFFPRAAILKISVAGFKAFTKVAGFVKPTTRMIQVFGKEARRARLSITEQELGRLVGNETLSVKADVEDGYVILTHKEDILGLGLLLNGELRSQLPRHTAGRYFRGLPRL